ncbi:CDGSH iron-sulfur domain-containing protein [Lipingzhangella sp. LS1_29]|uniref:CDGSH iron-sulfur domain-containing protein n=1 Tax=Lipingzhangella rawalii TaxID=2055835 RepID=A0ABU2HBH5_9ACTN|nr:CDGSH iron-sulfur domain-containing protein [Lipingzhangella rawalii]MDS1272653.1 CDGSH iron-sulfur domain-containing protein [Lipingzhangella rawalii]
MSETSGERPSTVVKAIDNGPYQIKGDFVVVDREGQEFDLGGRSTAVLCRCGRSANKPFCDGSHTRDPQFQADERAEVCTRVEE